MEQQAQRKKIGLLGGSFDPIHQGHLNIAAAACAEYGLAEVWFIPAGHSPNKDETEMTSAEHRAAMVALAIQGYPKFKLSRIELDAAEISYTYRTLTKLAAQYPEIDFYFIMGADSLDYFEQWRRPEIICEKAVILVAARDSLALPQIREKIAKLQQLFWARIFPIQSGYTGVSSTMLREYFSSRGGKNAHPLQNQDNSQDGPGKDPYGRLDSSAQDPGGSRLECLRLLPSAVAEYITSHGLYGCSASR